MTLSRKTEDTNILWLCNSTHPYIYIVEKLKHMCQDTYMQMHVETLFLITKSWNNPNTQHPQNGFTRVKYLYRGKFREAEREGKQNQTTQYILNRGENWSLRGKNILLFYVLQTYNTIKRCIICLQALKFHGSGRVKKDNVPPVSLGK